MFQIELYETADGDAPVENWLRSLADGPTATRIGRRLRRLAAGNLGDSKPVGGGVSELRLDFGPGYRVYYSRVGRAVVVLLCGGDKATQKQDIRRATQYLADFTERTG